MDDYQKEMETNYPNFKLHIYAEYKEEFERCYPSIYRWSDYQWEMEANYPIFKKFVYAKLREEFERTLPPIDDVEALIEAGGVPLSAFIHEIEMAGQRAE